MSESKASEFKKGIRGCPKSLKGLGSRGNVSDGVVVENSDVHSLIHSDVMRHNDFSVKKGLLSNNRTVLSKNDDVGHCNGGSNISIRYFYRKNVFKVFWPLRWLSNSLTPSRLTQEFL